MATKKNKVEKLYSDEDIIAALGKSNGHVTAAAKMLGSCTETISYRIATSPEVRKAWRKGRRSLVDAAENKLRDAVEKGYFPAIMFALKTLGRRRGYVERVEQRLGGDEEALPLRGEGTTIDLAMLPVEIRLAILQQLEKSGEKKPDNSGGGLLENKTIVEERKSGEDS